MDAVKFVEERRRMFAVSAGKYSLFDMNTRAEDVVKEVEEWSAAHPRKTRQNVFLEQYPEADLDTHGVALLCPMAISAAHRNGSGLCAGAGPDRECGDCRREFWLQEAE